ncbi:hypothetical protein [Acetomicrobium sp.]|jgi:hypothetical protein|uniref:hypothetical protein n=2 Tax=Acetomicrobium TaxID=49894 RepID=UPI002BF0C432|nr:hypothetical protein [Acetomicrobium sp.]
MKKLTMKSQTLHDSFIERLARVLLGKIKVRSFSLVDILIKVRNVHRNVMVKFFTLDFDVICKSCDFSDRAFLRVQDASLCFDKFKLKRLTLRCINVKPKKVKLRGIVSVNSDISLCNAFPQERVNKIAYIRSMDFFEKGTIPIAMFCPIIKNKALKLILNKKEGVILVWYSRARGSDEPYYLFLCRKLGQQALEESVVWTWVSMGCERSGGG